MTSSPFFDRLAERARTAGTLLCPGLDPRLSPGLEGPDAYRALVEHAERLLDATAPLALCFKPNLAFYERHGADGWRALADIIPRLQRVAPVIADAKRGDIGSTATAYAHAIFDTLGADAVTVSAALGPEGLLPFLERPDRGVFALLRTSNPGADLVQEQLLATGLPAWRAQLEWLEALRLSHPGLGYVVGATHPMVLLEARRVAPSAWFLAPGVGAQGADPARTLRAGARKDGLGLIVPVSRAIDAATDPASAAEVIAALLPVTSREPETGTVSESDADPRDHLVRLLVAAGCVRFGTFTLKSGLVSPVYLDLRRLVARPSTLAAIAGHYAVALAELHCDHLAALPYAALPIGTAVSLHTGLSLVYPRKERKGYGTDAPVEGVFAPGDTAVILDDVVTRGDAKLEALAQLRAAGLEVSDMVVLVDREEGAGELLAAHGARLHAVMTLRELAARAHRLGLIDADALGRVEAFVTRPRETP